MLNNRSAYFNPQIIAVMKMECLLSQLGEQHDGREMVSTASLPISHWLLAQRYEKKQQHDSF